MSWVLTAVSGLDAHFYGWHYYCHCCHCYCCWQEVVREAQVLAPRLLGRSQLPGGIELGGIPSLLFSGAAADVAVHRHYVFVYDDDGSGVPRVDCESSYRQMAYLSRQGREIGDKDCQTQMRW